MISSAAVSGVSAASSSESSFPISDSFFSFSTTSLYRLPLDVEQETNIIVMTTSRLIVFIDSF
ncbi:hypothetical protein ES703_62281 [subsurface metagenome]